METNNNFQISYYKNMYSIQPITVRFEQFVNSVKKENFKAEINKIRKETNKRKQTELKQQLPCITTSAIIQNARSERNIIEHSGLIQIDIDNIPEPAKTLSIIKKDTHTFCSFLSPSGKGAKVIFKIEKSIENHLNNYLSIENYFMQKYKITIDKICKDVVRLMFVSSDPNIYFNPNSTIFKLPYTPTPQHTNTPNTPSTPTQTQHQPHTPKTQAETNQKNVEIIITKIEQNKIDITSNYQDWLKIGFALFSEFNITGLNYFIRISSFYPKFDRNECIIKYNEISKYKPKTSINSFFGIASDFGIYLK